MVWADDAAIAFLDIAPATPGHTLVIPRAHADDLWSIRPAEIQKVSLAMREVAALLRAPLPLSGLSVLQANGRAAWQSVFHLHFHLVPRYHHAELALPWIPRAAPKAELDAVHQILNGTNG